MIVRDGVWASRRGGGPVENRADADHQCAGSALRGGAAGGLGNQWASAVRFRSQQGRDQIRTNVVDAHKLAGLRCSALFLVLPLEDIRDSCYCELGVEQGARPSYGVFVSALIRVSTLHKRAKTENDILRLHGAVTY
ncbi:hypothetical protein NDU88_006384 [Pleurodeles waltl]|uniref:Uncharacterized protein n=1 Tax=Pleurodeles waltl TaxID=8319 RepID=A0AAV7TFD4_PLEWA|nr:hypothetical protein NDU88_006384 [Pleurodeles waltl]